MSRRKLELIRWACAGVCAAIVLTGFWYPSLTKGGLGLLLFFFFIIIGFPAAMLSLHLHGREWLGFRKSRED